MSTRILHVINSMNPLTGGPCQGIRNMDKESQKLGIFREIVSLDEMSASFLGSDAFPIHALGLGKSPWRYSLKLIPWLVNNLERFDVVIVNGIWLFHSYAAWRALHILKKKKNKQSGIKLPKVYVMPHGMLDPWFQEVKQRKLKAWRNWLYWKLIESRVVHDVDGLLFTCQTELLLARRPFQPYFPKQEINVGYGIDQPPVASAQIRDAFLAKCPPLTNTPYLLFLSRIHYKKGVDLLIEAYAKILQTEANERADIPKLVIAGPGLDTQYGQTILNRVAATSQLSGMVYFTDMLTGDAKWGAISGCKAFILPSHQENFGIAVVEAMSYGKPVLISNQINIWPEIEAGGGGLIADDTAEGTLQLLQNWLTLSAEKKVLMGQQAKATFERHFTIKQVSIRIGELNN